jgi:hypothetical protein
MSFLDDIIDIGSSLFNVATSSGVVGGLVRSTALGFLVNQVNDSTKKENTVPEQARPEAATTPDYGVREQVDPDTNHAIPVVYGTAFLGGIVTDAVLTNDNLTMWYCITVCEKTGALINGSPSVITFEELYWNGNKVSMSGDGVRAVRLIDDDGNVSTKIENCVELYFYNGGSNSPTNLTGFVGQTQPAHAVFPNWSVSHTMDDLVFCLVKVNYNRTAGFTGLGRLEFKIRNSMSQPGDVLNDYMTNTRYGAGIGTAEIYSV